MKNILVPTDFAKPSINALDLALDIAQQSTGTVHLIHVIELPIMHESLLMPTLNFEEELLKELRAKAIKSISKLISKHNKKKVNVTSEVIFGTVTLKIIDYIKTNKIDLVVMGSDGTDGIREVLVGSNAEKIVRKSTAPVLVVKEFHKGPVKNIVFPISIETEEQDDLVTRVKVLQNFFKAHLHIVWINTPSNFLPDVMSNKLLDEYVNRNGFDGYSTDVFNAIEVEQGIFEYTKSVAGDMIAMGTHGRTGLAHFMKGSLTEDMVNHYKGLIWTYAFSTDAVVVS